MRCILDVTNKTGHALPPKRFFIAAAERTFKALKPVVLPEKTEMPLSFVSKKEIRRLNKAFRGKDKATDVLSFPHAAAFPKKARRLPKLGKIVPTEDADGVVRLGEIIISPEVVQKEAALFGHSVRKHHIFLFVHGLLHLLGYDHERSVKEEKEMFRLQDKIFQDLG